MKVLSLGTDRNLFMNDTEVRERTIKYGRLVEELHIVVFSKRSLQLTAQKISDNVWIHPTNSLNRWFYVMGATATGKKIIARDLDALSEDVDSSRRWIITAQDPFECGYVGYKIARRFGYGFQLQVHTDFLNPHFLDESRLNKARVRIARKLIPKATCIRVVSDAIKNSILNAFPGITGATISILPIFVDLQKIKSGEITVDLKKKYPQFDFHILLIARLEREKNIPLALSTLKDVVSQHPKTGLIVIGEGSENAHLKKQALEEGIHNNVVFEGWQGDLSSYYKTADALLVTSNYEGFGRMFIEAAAVGCPIVTTDVGVARELILDDESSFICPVGNQTCLARNIERLIKYETARHLYSLKLEARAQRITITDEKTYLERYGELWRQCLK